MSNPGDNFSPEDQARLLELLRRQEPVQTLEQFIQQVSPNLPPPDHVRPIMELFERSRKEEVRAVISMPPGFAKSVTAMHGLAWRAKMDPACKNAYLSCGLDLARRHSREVKRLAIESGIELSKEAQAVEEWQTKQHGAFYARGVGGLLTGSRISGVAVADDLIKDAKDASSINRREDIWEWFSSVLTTRLLPGASVIVIATRWHYDDIIGRLIDRQGDLWEVISMPAVHDGNMNAVDVDHPDAVSLWPELYTMDHMRRVRKTVTDYTWSALYQGNPVPIGAEIFDPMPARYNESEFKLDGHRMCITVDPAATASTRADYSVLGVCAMKGEGENSRMWMRHVEKYQVTIPELVRRILALQEKWKLPVAVESVGAFKAVPDMLREANAQLKIIPVPLKGDKYTRAQPYAAAWNDGRVLIPQDAPWADGFIAEHSIFTGLGDAHDDQVDMGAHGFTTLYRARATRRGNFRGNFLPFG